MRQTYLEWYKEQELLWVDGPEVASGNTPPFANLAGSALSHGNRAGVRTHVRCRRRRHVLRSAERSNIQWGSDLLRGALAAKYGVEVESVMTTAGGSLTVPIALQALRHEYGTFRVLCEQITYGPLFEAPEYLRLPIDYFMRPAGPGMPLDLRATPIPPDTRLVILCNPNNPTGQTTPAVDILAMVEALPPDVMCLVDETFLGLADPSVGSVASFRHPRLISVNSLSKTHNLSELRCGWIIAHGEVLKLIRQSWALLFNSPSRLTEAAALEALRRERQWPAVQATLAAQRALVAQHLYPLVREGLIEWHPPEHGCLAFPRIVAAGRSSNVEKWMDDFYIHLRDHSRIAVVPGKWFRAPTHVRIGFGCKPPTLALGLERLTAAIRERNWSFTGVPRTAASG